MEVIYDFFTSFAGVCVIVAAGYLVGRVRVRGISLGLAGVLICAVFFGAAFSACGFDVSSVPMFGVLSKIGTSVCGQDVQSDAYGYPMPQLRLYAVCLFRR